MYKGGETMRKFERKGNKIDSVEAYAMACNCTIITCQCPPCDCGHPHMGIEEASGWNAIGESINNDLSWNAQASGW